MKREGIKAKNKTVRLAAIFVYIFQSFPARHMEPAHKKARTHAQTECPSAHMQSSHVPLEGSW